MYNTGIALGGGGARGFAHLGVLHALLEKGIKPDVISGVSSGAIIGAFICSGKTPLETMHILKKYKLTSLAGFNFHKNGLFSLSKLRHILEENIHEKAIQDLKTPLYIAATNLQKGHIFYFHAGPLVTTIEASSSIPILFAPVNLDGNLYVDGGLLDNIPVRPLEGKCQRIISVNISPMHKEEEVKNIIDIAIRTFHINVNSNLEYVKQVSDVYIEPTDVRNFALLDTSKAQDLFDIGYNYTKKLEL